MAEQAGVSTTAVSEILAGKGRYAPDTVERVKKAAHHLQYIPSRRGRAMQAGLNHCVTIIADIPTAEDAPYQAMILTGVALEARRFNYSVELVETPGRSDWSGVIGDTDGIIASGLIARPSILDEVRRSGKPLIRVNPGQCGPADCVGPDDAGGADAIGHLIRERGYERVVYGGGLSGAHASVEIRARALTDAVKDLDFRHVPFQSTTATELLREYCTDGRGRTAFVGYGDMRLVQFLVAGARLGLECPRDFGLAACHMRDQHLFAMLGLDLCGATHSLQLMGHEAGKMMMHKLNDAHRPQPSVLIPEEIHVGTSLREPDHGGEKNKGG